MFDFFFRLHLKMEGLVYTDYEYALLLRDRGKANCIASLICFTLFIFPIIMIATALIVFTEPVNERITLAVFFIAYLALVFWFIKKFMRPLRVFEKQIEDLLYANKHTLKGNAISAKEFEDMEISNPELYSFITSESCRGNCYQVCFDIMQTLETGEFLLAAIHRSSSEDTNNKYTMHALYVNNDWCFDTYTQKQIPLHDAIYLFRGKVYKRFPYNSVIGKSLYEFRDEIYPALKEWCNKNDCQVQMYENEP